MGVERAHIRGFPPGGYFCIQEPLVSIELAHASWGEEAARPDDDTRLLAIVKPSSSLPLRRAVQQIAHYFHREREYDVLQFDVTDKKDYETFLWYEPYINDKGRADVVGACCFHF